MNYNDIPEIDYNTLLELSEIGISSFEQDAFNEGVISDTKEKIEKIIDLRKQWQKIADSFTMHKWVHKLIKDDKQNELLHKYYDIICKDKSELKYGEYKKAYNFFCQFFGLKNKGTIIEWITFDRDKEAAGQKRINCKFSNGIARVNIPDGMMLYHSSPAANITSLIPTFKSKTKGKYFYPDNRVFFTVQKTINPYKYGMGSNKYFNKADKKLYLYTPKENIRVVYIDPSYSLRGESKLRSVYISTDKPIPVIDISKLPKDSFGYSKKKIAETAYAEDLEIDDVVMESVTNKEMKELMRSWKTQNEDHKIKVFKSNNVSDADYHKLFDLVNTLRSEEDDYVSYRKAFHELCKFCHIVPKGTIITKIKIKSGSTTSTNRLLVEYSYNTKKIKLPEGMKLYHISKVAGIKELIPAYRGKSVKGYLYESPRVYFTIHKEMPKFLADYKWYENMHKYVSKVDFKEVYVDPLVWVGSIQGAVYVETSKNIPVEEMGIHKKDDKKE